ncbi:hypothetical protein [Allocoleopsis sp.]
MSGKKIIENFDFVTEPVKTGNTTAMDDATARVANVSLAYGSLGSR